MNRQHLLLSAAERFNEVTADMERLGLVILKDENGEYVARGNRNIKINGENFKPILARAVSEAETIEKNEIAVCKVEFSEKIVVEAVNSDDEKPYF